MPEPVDPGSPAATVILLRDTPHGIETLLLHRNTKADFAGGMAVFPGGRVDDEDWDGLAPGDDLAAARVAAARETHEEAGLVIEPDALVPHSHWQPPMNAPKRFLTWFFVGNAPDAVVDIDGAEIVDHVWMRPVEALAQHAAGALDLMPPTFVTLTSLARFHKAAEVIEEASGRAPSMFMAEIHPHEEGRVFLFEGDAGRAEPVDLDRPGSRRRLYMTTVKPWRWEESG